MLKNLFGKKKDGFYVQIEDDAPSTPVVKTAPTVKEEAPVETTPVAETPVVEAAPVADTPATEVVAPAEKTTKKSKVKSAQAKKEAPIKEEAVAVVALETPAPVAPSAPVYSNFATDYLIKPSSNSDRRRPGANMNMYLSMAKEVKKK